MHWEWLGNKKYRDFAFLCCLESIVNMEIVIVLMKYLRIQGFMLWAAEQTKDFIKDILNYRFMLKCG